ncbi:tyrosine-type recombinase/integrase [Peribacillus sp. R9-11]|uniref:tyrosine-type recombinase/integrase n=1 Tax=Peribacillus sp. R9-11 TaxID=3073271 RepID=UPI00286917F3|nr:tyrosine-type recombinase/integrase [Peribacillus sp. R9-11]WMX58057.1 tyrosine-type recombinase/integrase [Peribacillus sp. R9-11]
MSVKLNKKTGKWEFCFDLGKNPITGKRKQIRRRGFVSKDVAVKAYVEVKSEILGDAFVDISSMKYEQFMDEYWEERKISLQSSTYETHTIFYKKHIQPRLGKIKLQGIRHTQIQRTINELVSEKYSPETVHLIYRIMNASFKKAILLKLIKENPCSGATLPKRNRREMNIWSLDQVNYFLQEAPHVTRVTRCLIGFQIGLLAGLRQGEILALRWKDIDFEKGIIYIRQTLTQSAEIKNGAKNNSSVRSLTIPNRLLEELKIHRKLIDFEKVNCKLNYQDHDLVLPTRYGAPMIPRNFRKEFYNITKYLNLPKIRFHDLRHTHATLLIEQNINVKLIADRLGHTDIETTLNTYSHVLPNMQRSVSDKLDEIIKF